MSIGVVVCGRFCPKSFLNPYFGANLHDFIRAPGFDVTGCTGWGATWFEVRLGQCRRFEGNPPWRSRDVVKQQHSVWANPWESKYRHMDLIWIKKYRQLAGCSLTLDLVEMCRNLSEIHRILSETKEKHRTSFFGIMLVHVEYACDSSGPRPYVSRNSYNSWWTMFWLLSIMTFARNWSFQGWPLLCF